MTLMQKKLIGLYIVLMAIYSLYEVYDELNDLLYEGEYLWHGMIDIIIVVFTFTALYNFFYYLRQQSKENLQLEKNLKKVKKQLESSNIRLQQGKKEYQKVIQWQFKEWELSPSEKEIALLMLKGLSIKEISKGRSTHEKTVRKQASAIYEKSGLAGRHELSAWFFEDLLK